MLIQWNDSLSVSVGDMDGQHKKLFALINGLNDAMRAGKGKDIMSSLLKGLYDYTVEHFSAEEKVLEKYAYPGLMSQRVEHRKFTGKIAEYQTLFEKGSTSLSIQIMDFLSDWLKNHIMKTDKQYGAFLNGKGIK